MVREPVALVRGWSVVVCVLVGCENPPVQQAPLAPAARVAVSPAVVASPAPAPVLRELPATLGYVTLKALHMDCAETCPTSARVALQRVASVYQVGVDLDHEALFVSYDLRAGDAQQAAVPMLAALRAIGFDPWLKAEGWPDNVRAADVTVLPL